MLTTTQKQMEGRKPQRTPTQPVARDPRLENDTIHPNREHPRVKSLKVKKADPSKMPDKSRTPAPSAVLSKTHRTIKQHLRGTRTKVADRTRENSPSRSRKHRPEPAAAQPDVGRNPLPSKKRPSLKNVLHSSAPRARALPKSVVKRVKSDVKRGR